MAHYLVVERLRSEAAWLAHSLAVLVAELVGELLYWLTHCDGQHVVNGAQHLGLALVDCRGLLAVGHHLA